MAIILFKAAKKPYLGPAMTLNNELRRRIVHIGCAGFALAIGHTPAWFVTLLCFVALAFNVWILPRLSRGRLERDTEKEKGYSLGMLAYPAVLGLLSIVFYRQQVLLAVAWGAMAFGDGFSNLAGRKWGKRHFPWHEDKSWVGTAAFVLAGWLGTMLLLLCLPVSSYLGLTLAQWAAIVAVAIVVSAAIETVPGLINDNISVPVAAGVVAWGGVHLAGHTLAPGLPNQLWLGLALVAGLTGGSLLTRKIDLAGALTGGLLTLALFLGAGLVGIALIFSFFVGGTLLSMFRHREKESLGVAQEKGGKRSYPHALANAAVPAACGLLAWLSPDHHSLMLAAMAGSFAAALGDTASSEIGTIYGRRFVSILTLQPATRGEDGAVSYEGSFAGMGGSLLIAMVYGIGTGWEGNVGLVFIAGLIGNLADSVLGASLQRWGLMNNHSVNFVNTAIAAFIIFL